MPEGDARKFRGLGFFTWLRRQLGPDSRLWHSTMAISSALLLLAAFPPFSIDYCAWVALGPLLHVITRGIRLRRAFWLGWLCGVVFTFFAENWIAHSMTHFGGLLTVVAYAVAFLFASLLAVFPALFALTMAQLVRTLGPVGLAGAPIVWVATEWLRPVVTGVTWNALGISQVRNFPIARLSQYGGAYLISWELVGASTLLLLFLRGRQKINRQTAAAVILMMLVPLLLPAGGRVPNGDGPSERALQRVTPVRILGVQPHIPLGSDGGPEEFTRKFAGVRSLTLDGMRRNAERKPDLVIWAESPLALFYENDPSVRERVDALAKETGAFIVANTITREADQYFNSVHVISPRVGDGKPDIPLKRYDKIRLVPFGEYVPWRAVLGRFVPAIVGDFAPGRDAVVNTVRLETIREGLAVNGPQQEPQLQIERNTRFVRIGAFICYEAAYPDLVRQFVNNGATLLVNVSNDAWFGDTAGPEQHLAHAMMRAIENDRDLVRVTNSGITALITSDGVVVDALPRSTAAFQAWEAMARGGVRTFYTRHGDLFAIGCTWAATLLAAICVTRWLLARRAARSLEV
ncbi:MAG: apolipoprotein N-acyltransferase [Acidobacteriota bacterium]